MAATVRFTVVGGRPCGISELRRGDFFAFSLKLYPALN